MLVFVSFHYAAIRGTGFGFGTRRGLPLFGRTGLLPPLIPGFSGPPTGERLPLLGKTGTLMISG